MKELRFFIIVALFALPICTHAQYWFQFGARGGTSASMNNGASVEIKTIQQNISQGSLGFWVGETLSNDAFVQCGYLIENETGNYPSICNESGCFNYQVINAGDAEWFYEYFPPNYNGGFLGGIGPEGSAGINGSMHRYGFYSVGNTWYFTFDGKIEGSAELGTDSSGNNVPVAFGEVANTSINYEYIKDVLFENLSAYQYNKWYQVAKGYSYIGYGVGSENNEKNLYGVKEIGSIVNYFEVGSGLPQLYNGTVLWNLGYYLIIKSQYGNIGNTTKYVAYSKVRISAPQYIYLSPDTKAVFSGWIGKGFGSYTGPDNSSEISIDGNITETAQWKIEYFVGISSQYGTAKGTGWYENGSIIEYNITPDVVYKNNTTRFVFMGWSNGNRNLVGYATASKPANISAEWEPEYLVLAKTPYGNATGTGWYKAGSTANLSLQHTIINQTTSKRMAFYEWSNGNTSPTFSISVSKPISISAKFKNEYLVKIVAENAYGQPINVTYMGINGKQTNGTMFLFGGNGSVVNYVMYKGVRIYSDKELNVSGPERINITLSVYNVKIETTDIFGLPINAYAMLTFSNKTTYSKYTNGNLELTNVPYGYVNASISYIGITQHALVTGGGGTTLIFFSLTDFAVVIMVGGAIAATYFISKRRFKQTS
ncbi:MAG: hypothetical protein ACP5RT_00110 [Candidatus Micrarchaeia archaeon]